MTDNLYYSSKQQFCRALAINWSLYKTDMIYGVLYVIPGFFAHRLGLSQVCNVFFPFLMISGFITYYTWRICSPYTKRTTTPYFINLPQDRIITLYAHLIFLSGSIIWLISWVFAGCAFKLAGAGITACYRIHPEFVVFPFLAVTLTMLHIYSVHSWSYWIKFGLLLITAGSWLFWRIDMFDAIKPCAKNNFWPQREMPLAIQCLTACIILGISACLFKTTCIQWRKRQTGAIL